MMTDHVRLAGLLLLLSTAVPAAAATQARLVHCGAETCLRLEGRRPDPAVAVRVGGRELPVEGERAWQATLPMSQARELASGRGERLMLTLVDPHTGIETSESVAAPPGALGPHIELASLVVRAH